MGVVTSSKANCEPLLTKFQLIRLNAGLWVQGEELLLLIQQQIEQLLASNEQLQIFLIWVSQKSRTAITRHKPVIVRAFYFDLALARALGLVGGTLELARSFEPTLTRNLERTLALDLALDRVLGLAQVIALSQNPQQVVDVVLERAVGHARAQEPRLEQALLQLKTQLPLELGRDANNFKQWWSSNGRVWTEQLRAAIIEHRNLGHNWQFNHQQKEVLKQYYNLNCWLVDCLDSSYYSCYIDSQVRAKIESSLLLPLLTKDTGLRELPRAMADSR